MTKLTCDLNTKRCYMNGHIQSTTLLISDCAGLQVIVMVIHYIWKQSDV